jgi:predicted DNA-binding antitoxin AbrB/MazE fold protein
MTRHLEAIYEQGVLRPLEPLALAEHQRVRLTLEEKPSSWLSADPVNERREEMQWLAKESAPYAGQWVALDGARLVAHGAKLATVSSAAKAAGVDRPFFASVPDHDLPFAGW